MANTHSTDLERSSSQYWSITDASQTGLALSTDFTIEAWIKIEQLPSTAGGGFMIAGKTKDAGVNRSYGLVINSSDKFRVFYSSDGNYISGSMEIIDANSALTSTDVGVWVHVAVTVDISAKTAVIYKNGTSLGTTEFQAGSTTIFDGDANFEIGNDSADNAQLFDGLVDDVRVWNDIRTGTEILNNMQTELVGDEANLQGYWKFNNDGTDETSNGNDLTNNGTATFSTDVPTWTGNTYSLSLNGTSQGAYTTSLWSTATTNVTMEAWFKTGDLTQDQQTIVSNGRAAGGYSILVNNGTSDGSLFLLDHAVAFLDTGYNVPDTNWHHVALVLDGSGNAEVYVDGKSVYTDARTYGTPASSSSVGIENNSPTTREFNGEIDEVRFWSDIRTSTEIITNMQTELVGDEANLVAYYKLNNDLTDTAGSNTLTNVGTATFTTEASFIDESTDLEQSSNQSWSITNAAQTGLYLTGDFTIECWYKPESFTANHAFFSTIDNSPFNGYRFYRETSVGLAVQVAKASSFDSFNTWGETLNNGTWYHLAIAYDASAESCELFIDGVSQGTKTGGSNTGAGTSDQGAIIGAAAPPSATAWNLDGLLDDFRVWNDIRTGTEIDDNKCAELVGTEANLVGYWRFNNNSVDQSGNGNALTNNASATFSTTIFTEAGVCAAVATENALSWCNF
jgi:hypothetical protein